MRTFVGQMALVRTATVLSLALPLTLICLFEDNVFAKAFWILFVLRYTRFIGHCIAYIAYRPDPVPLDPSFTQSDVTVILPTVEPLGPDFLPCVLSILRNNPHTLLVVTVGPQLLASCKIVLQTAVTEGLNTQIRVAALPRPSKRRQVAYAMPHVETPITILADDHVFWPSLHFLPAILAPFENPRVGIVATNKRVVRTTPGEFTWASCVNFIACNYLQRHNWELRASNAIDGGVFVVSGRTAAYRTEFLQDTDFLTRYCHETFFFGLLGGDQGLGPDDDNFITREAMKKGWLIRFQDTPDATVVTTLGVYPKIVGQFFRWGRTYYRSVPVMLRDPSFFSRYTWSYFMVYWASLFNFALVWDVALLATLICYPERDLFSIVALVFWILLVKGVKIIRHFHHHPVDIPLFFVQVAFAYLHSFIKLWALLTFWDCDWSGRRLDELDNEESTRPIPFERVLPAIRESPYEDEDLEELL